jgi:hypothetical protein
MDPASFQDAGQSRQGRTGGAFKSQKAGKTLSDPEQSVGILQRPIGQLRAKQAAVTLQNPGFGVIFPA